MLLLDSTPNVAPILDLIQTWTHIAQALVGSIGALAFARAALRKRLSIGGGTLSVDLASVMRPTRRS